MNRTNPMQAMIENHNGYDTHKNGMTTNATSTALEASLSRKIRSLYEVSRAVVTNIGHINQERKLILIADDEPLMFKLIEEFLEETKINAAIVTAPNGHKAYQLAEELAPDLIIADWLMPEFNGLDLVRKLKQNPLTKSIPVLLATGVLASEDQLHEFCTAGAVDYITKPIDFTQLRARVKRALELDESIKEAKQMRDSFDMQDEVLGALADAASIAIFYTDIEGRLLGCNSCFEMLFDVSRTEIMYRSFEAFLPPPVADILEVHFSTLSPGDLHHEFETQMSFGEQPQKQIKLSLLRIGENSHSFTIGMITDITQAMMTIYKAMQSNIDKLHTDLETKQRELALHTQLLMNANLAKEDLLDNVNKLHPYLNLEGKAKLLGLVKHLRRQLNDETLLSVEKKFDEQHSSFYAILEKYCPAITKNEKRLCAYLRMSHSSTDIARITNRSLNSINVGFARLRTKLGLPSNKDLRAFLNELNGTACQPFDMAS